VGDSAVIALVREFVNSHGGVFSVGAHYPIQLELMRQYVRYDGVNYSLVQAERLKAFPKILPSTSATVNANPNPPYTSRVFRIQRPETERLRGQPLGVHGRTGQRYCGYYPERQTPTRAWWHDTHGGINLITRHNRPWNNDLYSAFMMAGGSAFSAILPSTWQAHNERDNTTLFPGPASLTTALNKWSVSKNPYAVQNPIITRNEILDDISNTIYARLQKWRRKMNSYNNPPGRRRRDPNTGRAMRARVSTADSVWWKSWSKSQPLKRRTGLELRAYLQAALDKGLILNYGFVGAPVHAFIFTTPGFNLDCPSCRQPARSKDITFVHCGNMLNVMVSGNRSYTRLTGYTQGQTTGVGGNTCWGPDEATRNALFLPWYNLEEAVPYLRAWFFYNRTNDGVYTHRQGNKRPCNRR